MERLLLFISISRGTRRTNRGRWTENESNSVLTHTRVSRVPSVVLDAPSYITPPLHIFFHFLRITFSLSFPFGHKSFWSTLFNIIKPLIMPGQFHLISSSYLSDFYFQYFRPYSLIFILIFSITTIFLHFYTQSHTFVDICLFDGKTNYIIWDFFS